MQPSSLYVLILMFRDVLGVCTPSVMSKIARFMDMKFWTAIKFNKKKLVWSVNYRPESDKARSPEMQLLDMIASRNFAELSLLIKIQFKFKIDTQEIEYFLDQSLRSRHCSVCKLQSRAIQCDVTFTKFTGHCHVSYM